MRRGRAVLGFMIVMLGTGFASAQSYTAGEDRGSRRLFQRFIEDAAILPGGWIEGQFVYQNRPGDESYYFAGPLFAFRVVNNVEAGLRFGFADFESDGGPDGSGLSDIELYGKYRFPGRKSRLAVGALLKVPTADEEDGLGTGETDLELFAAWRADLAAVSLTANGGVRINGDPPAGSGDDSVLFGGGILLPTSPNITFVIEGTFESERIEGADNDARLTVGFQSIWRSGRGGFRGAVGLPLSDSAPDYEILFGVFSSY